MILVAGGRASNALLTLVTLYALTRLLPPGEYAVLALVTAFQAFAGLIVVNPAGLWFQRHLHEWHDAGSLPSRRRGLDEIQRFAALVTASLVVLWGGFVHSMTWETTVFFGALVAAIIYFQTDATVSSNVFNALGSRSSAVLWQLALSALGLILSAGLTLQWRNAVAWLAGQALAAVLVSLVSRATLRRVVGQPTPSTPHGEHSFLRERGYWRFALPLAALTSLMWLYGNGYRFILERAWDATALGIFLLALSVPAQMTAVLESIVMQYAYPFYFRRIAGQVDESTKAEATAAMTNALLPLYWAWGAFLCVATPQVIFLITAPSYHGAAQWAIYGALLEVARLTGNAWNLTAQARKDFRPLVLPHAVGAVGSLITALVVWHTGASAQVFAAGLLLAALVQSALMVIRSRNMLPLWFSRRRAGIAGLVLFLGLMLGFLWRADHGPLVSILIIAVAGVLFSLVAYVHLRTARFFHSLAEQRLA
ncbi:lipopolysaccharide biosynthesis protein [Thiobacter aerophilum]|uniref:Oligosaccharide flippase family protein n=1 Tax=Thiobacter aerophilum TaxID=3121275 RepID=A0ABV0EF32_9BURK